jgi:hypothetical protein
MASALLETPPDPPPPLLTSTSGGDERSALASRAVAPFCATPSPSFDAQPAPSSTTAATDNARYVPSRRFALMSLA